MPDNPFFIRIFPTIPIAWRRLLITALAILSTLSLEARSPNVLLIMADDLGAENLACYGNTIHQTPVLDALASEGVLFENAYSTPVCTPTRAMILTGLHPNRSGFLERLDSPLDPEKRNRLPVHLKTFAHVFKEAGYSTAIAGKWHLGDFQAHPDQPKSHGFDEYCLWVQYWDRVRHSRYYGPHNWENGEYIAHDETVYGPDYYTDFLIDFIERHKDEPFLAYFPMNLVHTPLVPPPGLKELAEKSFPDDLGPKERIAAHMVTYMDGLVGKLLKTLDRLELAQNTLVIFTGDNGSSTGLTNRLGEFLLRGGKRTMNEAGTRVPLIARWPGRFPTGKQPAFFSLMDILPTLASIADIPIQHDIDGMDLSHNLYGKPGNDRTYIAMAFEGDVFFIRDHRFRLHEDGRFYEVSVSSNKSRYSMEILDSSLYPENRQRLQKQLDAFMKIQQTDSSYQIIPFGTNGDSYKNRMDKTN